MRACTCELQVGLRCLRLALWLFSLHPRRQQCLTLMADGASGAAGQETAEETMVKATLIITTELWGELSSIVDPEARHRRRKQLLLSWHPDKLPGGKYCGMLATSVTIYLNGPLQKPSKAAISKKRKHPENFTQPRTGSSRQGPSQRPRGAQTGPSSSSSRSSNPSQTACPSTAHVPSTRPGNRIYWLFQAAQEGCLECVRRLVEEEGLDVDSKSQTQGWSALSFAEWGRDKFGNDTTDVRAYLEAISRVV